MCPADQPPPCSIPEKHTIVAEPIVYSNLHAMDSTWPTEKLLNIEANKNSVVIARKQVKTRKQHLFFKS